MGAGEVAGNHGLIPRLIVKQEQEAPLMPRLIADRDQSPVNSDEEIDYRRTGKNKDKK
jgi:hypothetical protein